MRVSAKSACLLLGIAGISAHAQITAGPNGVMYCNGQPCTVHVQPQISNFPPAPVNYSAMQVQPDPVTSYQRSQLMQAQIEESRARTALMQAEAQRAQAQPTADAPADIQNMIIRARAAEALSTYALPR